MGIQNIDTNSPAVLVVKRWNPQLTFSLAPVRDTRRKLRQNETGQRGDLGRTQIKDWFFISRLGQREREREKIPALKLIACVAGRKNQVRLTEFDPWLPTAVDFWSLPCQSLGLWKQVHTKSKATVACSLRRRNKEQIHFRLYLRSSCLMNTLVA